MSLWKSSTGFLSNQREEDLARASAVKMSYSLGAAAGAFLRAATSWVGNKTRDGLEAIVEEAEEVLEDQQQQQQQRAISKPIDLGFRGGRSSGDKGNRVDRSRAETAPPAPTRKWSVETVETAKDDDDDEEEDLPEISLSEVAAHCTAGDAWMVIYDKVYDVTDFLAEHPGGDDVMLEYAGYDASVAFRGVGHSPDAVAMLRQYLVGVLPMAERLFRDGESFSW